MSTVERPHRVVSDKPGGPYPSLRNLPHPNPRVTPTARVKLCYTLMHAGDAVGIHDLADGEYRPADTTLEEGIERQLNYLLDQVGCTRPGFRLLEIGTGYGHLQQLALARGADVVGVNVSQEQVDYCNQHGAHVYCCTYRDLLDANEWHGRFDGVIANGSLEHWVQPEDVLAGRMDEILHESFAIAYHALDPAVADARYVTTALHFTREVHPEDLLIPWYRQPRGSDRRHWSLLHHWMSGWYPVDGQLEECAQPYFTLVNEIDGTEGYKIASEYRMARIRRGLYASPKLLWRLARSLVRHPFSTSTMLECYLVEQSWDWQFRGDKPPTKLLRQTWRRNVAQT